MMSTYPHSRQRNGYLSGAGAAFLFLAAAACKPPLYSGPVVVQGDRCTGAVEGYMTLYAQIYEGSRSPLVLRGVRGKCEDPKVCQVAVVSGNKGDEIRVAGARPGSTHVKVSYVHPVRKEPGSERVRVIFAAGRVAPLQVGRPAVTRDRLLVLEGPGGQAMSCASASLSTFRYNGFVGERLMSDRVRLFECEKPQEILKGKQSFYDYSATPNRWNRAPFGSTVLVCATTSADGKEWSSLSIYSRDGKNLLARDGVAPEDLCRRIER
jgi:hypothetical protein